MLGFFIYTEYLMDYDYIKPTFNDWFTGSEHLSDKLSAELEWNLTKDCNFSLPDWDWDDFKIPDDLLAALKKGPRRLTEADLTERKPKGKGMFDAIMQSYSAHLLEEYEATRITGAEYTKAYIALGQTALTGAIQYLTAQEQLYWQSIAAQLAAIKAMVDIAIAKMQLAMAMMQAYNARVTYANTKLTLAVTNAQYGLAVTNTKKASEEVEATRAQTVDTRTDGATVAGIVGKQKDVYSQQVLSYKHHDQTEATKLHTDAWQVMRTSDEGLLPPSAFENSTLDSMLTKLNENVFGD